MKARTIANVVLLLIVLVFVIANWHVITLPTELNLLFGRVNAPLGVLLLIVAAAVFAIDSIVHALSKRTWVVQRRNMSREMEALRLRADDAEASRLKELQELIERESGVTRAQLERVLSSLQADHQR